MCPFPEVPTDLLEGTAPDLRVTRELLIEVCLSITDRVNLLAPAAKALAQEISIKPHP